MINLIHGGDLVSARERINGTILDFSANLNPLGLPETVRKVLEKEIESFVVYPDPLCRELTTKLSEIQELPENYYLFGNGAADLIFRVVWAFRPKRAMIVEPTFSEYRTALESVGCAISEHHMEASNDFMLTESLLDKITPSTDMLFLCNPNNPTGQTVDPTLLIKILVRCLACGTLLVVDECFQDFLEKSQQFSMKEWLRKFPNLLILNAFTKIYAMAGLRLGYCTCGNYLLLERMSACSQPWSVSTPAQIAGLTALNDTKYLHDTKWLIKEERTFLKNSLDAIGITIIGSQANFLFFRLQHKLETPLEEQLEAHNILIRSCANFSGLTDEYYRIAVRTHEENEKLIEALTFIFRQSRILPSQINKKSNIPHNAESPYSPLKKYPWGMKKKYRLIKKQ